MGGDLGVGNGIGVAGKIIAMRMEGSLSDEILLPSLLISCRHALGHSYSFYGSK